MLYIVLWPCVCSKKKVSVNDLVQERYEKVFKKEHGCDICLLPANVQKALYEMIKNNKALLDKTVNPYTIVSNPEDPANSPLKKYYDEQKEQREQQQKNADKSANLSQWNIKLPFVVDNKTFLMCQAGPLHRRENYNAAMGRSWGTRFLNPAEVDAYIASNGAYCFQGISVFTNAMNIKKVIKECNLKHCDVAQTYLEHIPGKDKELDDANYVTVQEFIEGATSLARENIIKNLTPEQIDELYSLCTKASLWNIDHGNIVMANNKMIVVDTQQPNTTAPAEFLATPYWRFVHNGFAGVERLHQLCTKFGNQVCADRLKAKFKKDLKEYAKNSEIFDQLINKDLLETFAKRYNDNKKNHEMTKEKFVEEEVNRTIQERLNNYFANME